MSIPQHRKNRAKSRNVPLTIFNEYVQCEVEWCYRKASSIHHINCSYRGIRDDEAKWLLAVCNECHIDIHNGNTYELRAKLLDRVSFILKNINETAWTLWMYHI